MILVGLSILTILETNDECDYLFVEEVVYLAYILSVICVHNISTGSSEIPLEDTE